MAKLGFLPDAGGKGFLVLDRPRADRAQRQQDQLPEGGSTDVVTAADRLGAGHRALIGAALIYVLDPLDTVFGHDLCPAVVHPFTAVCAEHQAGQRIGLVHGVRSPLGLPQFLDKLPGLRVDNGLVGVLEDQPILFGIGDHLFALVRFLVTAEVYGMAEIFRLGQDLGDRLSSPVIGAGFLRALPVSDALPGIVV